MELFLASLQLAIEIVDVELISGEGLECFINLVLEVANLVEQELLDALHLREHAVEFLIFCFEVDARGAGLFGARLRPAEGLLLVKVFARLGCRLLFGGYASLRIGFPYLV